MCLLIVKPSDGVLHKRELREAFRCNSDGAGFMYADGELHIDKGYFGFRKFYKAFRAAERENPESTFVLHFRLATHGRTDAFNCHPYQIHKHLGFAHNGVMGSLGNKEISDSADFAWRYLSRLPEDFCENPDIWQSIERAADRSSSKFAFLYADGRHYIANENEGHWRRGAWYSNYSYVITRMERGTGWQSWYGYNRNNTPSFYQQCSACSKWYKRSLMVDVAGLPYCADCYEVASTYVTVVCDKCNLSTILDKDLRCVCCGALMDDDVVASQLMQLN